MKGAAASPRHRSWPVQDIQNGSQPPGFRCSTERARTMAVGYEGVGSTIMAGSGYKKGGSDSVFVIRALAGWGRKLKPGGEQWQDGSVRHNG